MSGSSVVTRRALHDAVWTLHAAVASACCGNCAHFLVPADTPDNRRGDASVCECMLHPGCNNLRNWPFRNTKCMDWRACYPPVYGVNLPVPAIDITFVLSK